MTSSKKNKKPDYTKEFLPAFQDIRKIIKDEQVRLELKPKDFVNSGCISQSMFSKVERGKAELSFSKGIEILAFLKSKDSGKETVEILLKKRLMENKEKLTPVFASESIKSAYGKLFSSCFSQAPVMKNDDIVGSISEKRLHYVLKSKIKEKTFDINVEDVMDVPLPIVPLNMRIEDLEHLMEIYNVDAVLTIKTTKQSKTDNKKEYAIITHADLAMYYCDKLE